MSKLKFVPNLFLEVAELNRFSQFLDIDGFRKNILENSVKFGLVKSNADPTFANGRVLRDVDTVTGQKTLKIESLQAIDSNGNFIYSPQITGIPLDNNGNWYWLKVRYQYTNQEIGTVSISVNGDLVGTGTEFTKVLRGQPNFPATIKLTDSLYNTLEYQVLEVIDDTHAVLANPATNTSGIAEFEPEDNLHYAIVGTFTPGVAVPTNDKYPFQYDSMYYELVPETTLNTRPTPFVEGVEFYIARYQINGANVIIQDKRVEYWETKGSELCINIERNENPLIGIEAVKWQIDFNPADKNIVEVAWGMRSSNWSVNSSQNILVINSGLGGKFKTVNDFTDGDFNGWRVYTANGKYSIVVDSVKQGGAINLTLDVLDMDNYSVDGGVTFLTQTVLVVPNCEEVELICDANGVFLNPDTSVSSTIGAKNCFEKFTFPVNTPVARLDLEVYYDPYCYYNIQYRYKSYKDYGEYRPFPSDDVVGYLTESSFTMTGDQGTSLTYYQYTSDPVIGYIRLNICPWAYKNFKNKVDKGDIIGANTITNISTSLINLTVGVDKNYQYITGNISISNDVFFNLTPGLVDGNEFRIHFNCSNINLGGKNIYIVQNYNSTSGTYSILKKITPADVFMMKNQDSGIVFDMVYSDKGTWVMYQNYDTGVPFEIKTVDGVITDLFDTSTGMGKVIGLFGYCLCNQTRTINGVVIPNLSGRFIIGEGTYSETSGSYTYNVSNSGGEAKHALTSGENGPHSHSITDPGHQHSVTDPGHSHTVDAYKNSGITPGNNWGNNNNDTPFVQLTTDSATTGIIVEDNTTGITVDSSGSGTPHENRPPYWVLIYCKKVF